MHSQTRNNKNLSQNDVSVVNKIDSCNPASKYLFTPMSLCMQYAYMSTIEEIERGRMRKGRDLLFSNPAFDRSPCSSAYLSGRKRESDANNFFGAVSKLLILCANCVY